MQTSSYPGLGGVLGSVFINPTDVPSMLPGNFFSKFLAKYFSVPQKHPAPKHASSILSLTLLSNSSDLSPALLSHGSSSTYPIYAIKILINSGLAYTIACN